MIDPVIENYLEVSATPELYKLFTDVIGYLEGIEYDSLQDEIADIIFTPNIIAEESVEKEPHQINVEINNFLINILESELNEAGIEVVEDTTLSTLYDIMLGLFTVADSEQYDTIASAAMSDESPLSKLALMLELLAGEPMEFWETVLDSVQPETIKRILEVNQESVEVGYVEIDKAEKDRLMKLRLYSEYCDTYYPALKSLELAQNTALGLDTATYIASGVLQELFEGNEMNKLAFELYAMALMSGDFDKDPVTNLRGIAESYLDDIGRLTKFNKHIAEINAEFVKFYQVNSKGLVG